MATAFGKLSKTRKSSKSRKRGLKFLDIQTQANYDGRNLSFGQMAAEDADTPWEMLGVLLNNIAKHTRNVDYLFRNRIMGVLKKMTKDRFKSGGADVGGWPEISDMRVKQRLEKTLHRRVTHEEIASRKGLNNSKQPILRDTLELERSFDGRVERLNTGAILVWGSDLEQAPLMEYGGENQDGFKVPSRPMATPNQEHLMDIYDRLVNYYTKFLRQPWDPDKLKRETVPF